MSCLLDITCHLSCIGLGWTNGLLGSFCIAYNIILIKKISAMQGISLMLPIA